MEVGNLGVQLGRIRSGFGLTQTIPTLTQLDPMSDLPTQPEPNLTSIINLNIIQVGSDYVGVGWILC